jgi:hypothetical protein
MAVKGKQEAQNPLILRCHRLMDAFAKSDDERDFYLDRYEGFIVYVDLNKSQVELEFLEKEVETNADRYCLIPKLTFYETKKIMEGFVNEKVYDIDTKEKLLDIIQSKDARANFIEFILDHHSELEKWQQYYQERGRIRIIEWLRRNHFNFVFEEDLELSRGLIEKLKEQLFQTKVGKDVMTSRKLLINKAKTYYSTEALNPRPKRGRPPKQAAKQEIEPQISTDIYTTVPTSVRPFLYIPEIASGSALTFSSDFESREEILAGKRSASLAESNRDVDNISQKLAALRSLSTRWVEPTEKKATVGKAKPSNEEDEDSEDFDDETPATQQKRKISNQKKVVPLKSKKEKPASILKKNSDKPKIKPSSKSNSSRIQPKVKAKKAPAPEVKKRPKRIIPRHKNTTPGTSQRKMRILPKQKSTKTTPNSKQLPKPKPKKK